MKNIISKVFCGLVTLCVIATLSACDNNSDPITPSVKPPVVEEVNYDVVINGGTGSGEYAKDASVTATATAPTGKMFVKWNDADGNKVSDENPYVFEVTADTELTAIFDDIEFEVNIVNGTLANGEVSDSVKYNESVTATAVIPDDYTFLRWSDQSGEEISTDNPYTFNALSDVNLTAIFKAPDLVGGKAMVEIQNGNIKDTNLPFGQITPNTEITVVATVPNGSVFIGWVDAEGNELSSDLEYTLTISKSITLIAKMAVVKNQVFEAEGLDFDGLVTPGFSNSYEGVGLVFSSKYYASKAKTFADSISNGYFIGATHKAGLSFTYTLNSNMNAKDAELTLRLASQMRANQLIDNKLLKVEVNGVSLDYTAFNLTSSNSTDYDTPFEDFLLDVKFDLNKGDNTIKLTILENDIAASWGGTYSATAGPAIDNIKVKTYANLTWPTDKWEMNKIVLEL